jgi:L,D-peptidoglycan transpeptidase YkuD (ErfK/YbiS/YcfS/YnhG family)
MRYIFCILLLLCFELCIFNGLAHAQHNANHTKSVHLITKKNAALLDSIGQLIVVFNETPESNSATLVALEKKNNKWQIVGHPVSAGIGRKGFASTGAKREGDNLSPSGLFRLGSLFCYEKEVRTRMPFIQTTADDKWIDDPNSPDYNRHVRGTTTASTYEKLKIRSDEYKYCMVIEYNMHPVIKGKGSAIFLHLSESTQLVNPSSGCVVITEQDMKRLLDWMNPELKPSIIMGNLKVLISKNRNLKIKTTEF